MPAGCKGTQLAGRLYHCSNRANPWAASSTVLSHSPLCISLPPFHFPKAIQVSGLGLFPGWTPISACLSNANPVSTCPARDSPPLEQELPAQGWYYLLLFPHCIVLHAPSQQVWQWHLFWCPQKPNKTQITSYADCNSRLCFQWEYMNPGGALMGSRGLKMTWVPKAQYRPGFILYAKYLMFILFCSIFSILTKM